MSRKTEINGSSHHAEGWGTHSPPTNPPARHRFMKEAKDKGRLKKERGKDFQPVQQSLNRDTNLYLFTHSKKYLLRTS